MAGSAVDCRQQPLRHSVYSRYWYKSATSGTHLEVVEELEQQNKRILELMTQIREVDTSLQTSNGYIKKTLFNKDPASARDDSGGDMLMR
jgi:hypothetical protein